MLSLFQGRFNKTVKKVLKTLKDLEVSKFIHTFASSNSNQLKNLYNYENNLCSKC